MSSDEKELLIAIMVDDQNVSLDFHENRVGVDYKKLVQFIEKKYEALNPKIVLKKLYTAVNPKLTKAQRNFFYKIQNEETGFIVETRTIKTIILSDGGTKRKADVDTLLAFDMAYYIHTYDLLVILSGDSDYVGNLETLLFHGKQILIITTQQAMSSEIYELSEADDDTELIFFDGYQQEFGICKKGSREKK